jgi:uncharacterized protein with ATP-grasp and redox domains
MKTYLDCYPCFIEQALRAARMVSADETLQQKLLNRILEVLIDFPTGATPPQIAHRVYALIREQTGVEDPFREAKAKSTRAALALYPDLKRRYLAESCENVRDWNQKIASIDIFSGPYQVLIENIFAIQKDIVPTNRADMLK